MKTYPIVERIGSINLVKTPDCVIVAHLVWDNGKNIIPVSRHMSLSDARRHFGVNTQPKRTGALKAIEKAQKAEESRKAAIVAAASHKR